MTSALQHNQAPVYRGAGKAVPLGKPQDGLFAVDEDVRWIPAIVPVREVDTLVVEHGHAIEAPAGQEHVMESFELRGRVVEVLDDLAADNVVVGMLQQAGSIAEKGVITCYVEAVLAQEMSDDGRRA